MKIPLVGESYGLRSPAAAVQETLNLIPQYIDDPNEKGKNIGILRDAPGYHKILDLPGTNRGHWSGGGRVFGAADVSGATHVYEVGQGTYTPPASGGGTIISDHTLPGSTPDGSVVQFFGNGNQLLIVANGFAYIWNPPTGPIKVLLQIAGDLTTTDGTHLTWVDGAYFTPAMNGIAVLVNGSWQIATYVDSTHITVPSSVGIPPTGTTFPWSAAGGDPLTAVTGAYLDSFYLVQRPPGASPSTGTVDTNGTTATYDNGDQFTPAIDGQTITINNVAYTASYVSPTTVTLSASAGIQVGAPYTASVGADLGRQVNFSASFDGTNWDPLDFFMKEGYSDHLNSIMAAHEQLYLFGVEEMEIWQDIGAPTIPFQVIQGASTRNGSFARYAPCDLGEKVYFIGGGPRGTPVAYRLDGWASTRVSTHAVEAAWAANGDTVSEAVAYSEIHDGHVFWVINFTGSLNTWVYDETASAQAGTPIWHQRAHWNGTTFDPYKPRFHTFVQEWGTSGMHVVADATGTGIYESNLSYVDINGADTAWVRILPYLYQGGKRQYFNRMTLEMQTGSGNPITRDYTDDRGVTFINPVTAATAGSSSTRVVWPVNGSSQGRAFRFQRHGQVATTLVDLDLDMTVGVN